MLLSITTSCGQHIVYKTKTEVISPPKGLIVECEAVPVKEGATTQEELLFLVSSAYIETLKNMSSCNIKTKQALNYIEKAIEQNK